MAQAPTPNIKGRKINSLLGCFPCPCPCGKLEMPPSGVPRRAKEFRSEGTGKFGVSRRTREAIGTVNLGEASTLKLIAQEGPLGRKPCN